MRALISAIALFCDSIRQEKANTDTIVGVMPDNLALAAVGVLLPRLSIYVRLHLDPKVDPNPIEVILKTPDGEEQQLMSFSSDVANRARAEATEKPFAGIIGRIELTPFQVAAFGRATVTVKTPFETVVAGSLNFAQTPATTSSNEKPQLSPQSPGDAQGTKKKRGPSRPSGRPAAPKRQRKRPSPS